MLPKFLQGAFAKPCRLLMCAALAVTLTACGGGGGSPGTVGTPGTGTGTTPDPTTPVPVPAEPVVTLTVVDSAGSPVLNLSGTQTATVRALVKDAAGVVVPNAIVKFSVSDPLVTFSPSSGSALTNAAGVATVAIAPVAQTAGGAVAITASATVGTKTPSATVNLAVGPGVVVFDPTLALTIVDAAGGPVGSLSGVQAASARAVVKDSTGAVAANTIVKFTASDPSLLVFTPDSGSALTDASGVALITVKRAALTSAGAASVTATAVVGSKTASGTAALSVGSAPLLVGTLAFVPAPSAPLPAYSTASLNIPITSGGQPSDISTGLQLSSTCISDGTATLVLGPMGNGIQPATYTNRGCTRGTDVITASIGSSSKTISIPVDAASIGTIQFLGSDLSGKSIVLKGSGGLGRQESALLSYKVLDQNNQGLAGVRVDFSPSTTTGGLSISPVFGTTDANGIATTTVSSGTIPTPVRIFAQASRNGKTISGLSDTLIISTGLPIQKSMSLSVDSYNINGWAIDGTIANVTIRMADQYGNPISDDTAVSFVTEGGAIGSSKQGGCTTLNGGCSVQLSSQAFRPSNGRVTVLAYVQGLENFIDSNGDGQYTCTNYTDANGNATTAPYRPLVDICVSGGEPFTDLGDPFLDTNVNGIYEAGLGDLPFPYNRATGYSAAGNTKWGLNYIRASTEITFSDSVPVFVRQKCVGTTCADWTAADGPANEVVGLDSLCAPQEIRFRLYDLNNNPLPHKTSVTAGNADKVVPGSVSPDSVPSTTVAGGTIHTLVIKPEKDCKQGGSFAVQITAPGGSTYSYGFIAK